MDGTAYYYTDTTNVEFIVTRGQVRDYPRHMHARHWTVGVVLSGAVALTMDAGTQTVRDGHSFFIGPYEPHSLKVAPESSLFVACFDNGDVFSAEKRVLHELSLQIPLVRSREALLAGIFARVCMDNSLSRMPACHTGPALPDSLVSCSVQAAIRQMLDNPDAFSGVTQMAAYAGYSQWHFVRTFQKLTGMTPHAFQLLCRLRLLRGLLRADTASAVAAASAGFSDQSHMHKVFKRHHGMTPGQFKRASFRLAL